MGQGSSTGKQGNTASKITQKFSPKKGLIQFKKCTRNFAVDRIETHEGICITQDKKRKPFDMKKARVEGTEAAEFVEKKQNSRNKVSYQGSV